MSAEVAVRPSPFGYAGPAKAAEAIALPAGHAAVNDALAPLGVRLTELPMTPERILSALRAAGKAG
jgi:CO/xanthine dehydrogenase Mo-binding subunit